MGYGPPLPAPIPAVQATMAAIDIPEFHAFIQDTNIVAVNEADEEGLHAPLLLDTLDLAAWTSLFVLATSDKQKTVDRLRSAHSRLPELLVKDELDAVRSAVLAQKVEAVLKLANQDELTSEAAKTITGPDFITGNAAHPLLAKLKISNTDLSALEEFSEEIQSSQVEKQKSAMVTNKGPIVPIKPSRSVELLVTEFQHRMWAVGNTNLIAPISIPTWKTWAGMTENEVESCKKQAMSNIGVLRAPMDLMHAFPLTMFDHSKCTTLEVKLHTKQDLPTGHNRKESHLSEMWNVQRPYMRCLCNPRAVNGCKGSIIWFDHAVWTMINKLEVFFSSYPTSIARFAAFMIWMRESTKMAVRAAIVFQTSREYMIRAATQLSKNPHQRLLTEIVETPIANKIERLLKGPKFSLAHPGMPNQAPSPYKKQRLNLNATPSERASGGRGRNSPGGRGYSPGRGGRALRGRGGGRASWRSPNSGTGTLLNYTGFAGTGSAAGLAAATSSPADTNPGIAVTTSSLADTSPGIVVTAGSSTPVQPMSDFSSPLKGRVLLWDDEI